MLNKYKIINRLRNCNTGLIVSSGLSLLFAAVLLSAAVKLELLQKLLPVLALTFKPLTQ